MKYPSTLQQAIRYFSHFENCQRFMIEMRWPDGKVRCPTCKSENVTYLENARLWKCYAKHPRAKFSLKVGTIFEDSSIGLDKWLPAMWLIANCKNGISSYEMARGLGVTQKTAWFMDHRIRLAMQDRSLAQFDGNEVEADETFIGGLARNMHKDKKIKITATGGAGKAIVMGLLDRHSAKVRLTHVPNTQRDTLQPLVRRYVRGGSYVFTDAFMGYHGLDQDYVHNVIDHAERYVDGNVHTNKIENFWSLLKRSLKGTYVSVEPFHLFRYLDEQAFRYNARKANDGERFIDVASSVLGRRLTYSELTGKTESATEPLPA
ncbi:IS1595 family transposase [Candidatus Binatus sp.]|uniref:IS1595 family transposase n=1 Tax=Candidatus Binatus sp. TaxID=2811406 RepID=UPI002F93D0B4